MSKPLCIVSCPIDTYSGYGARSRDFVKSLIKAKDKEWDIKIIAQRWGQTPWNYLKDDIKEDVDLKSRIINALTMSVPKQPDVWIQITVPNEFQPVGKFNIGVTAGIETTICDPSWIDGCNRMNLNLVSSEHSKKVFQSSVFEQKNQAGQIVNKIELKKPIEVLFEGADLNKYFKSDILTDFDVYDDLNTIKEEFCYLFVGHWLQGEYAEDRKNVGYMIKAFLEVFKNKKNKPALILKTSQGANCLYNHPKVKAMVSFTKGEGFGRPLLEFSIIGKPIIASGWSGHMDFLSPDFSGLVGGKLNKVHPSTVVQNIILPDAQWFKPDDNQAGHALNDVFENYKDYAEKAKRLAYKNKQNFSLDKMTEKLDELIKQHIPEFPKQVELKLPKLKKVE